MQYWYGDHFVHPEGSDGVHGESNCRADVGANSLVAQYTILIDFLPVAHAGNWTHPDGRSHKSNLPAIFKLQ